VVKLLRTDTTLDLSWVCHVCLWIQHTLIRVSRDQNAFDHSPGLFAVFHALHRLLAPRHPPHALSNLAALIQSSMVLPPARTESLPVTFFDFRFQILDCRFPNDQQLSQSIVFQSKIKNHQSKIVYLKVTIQFSSKSSYRDTLGKQSQRYPPLACAWSLSR
jgi:hypothetical protein